MKNKLDKLYRAFLTQKSNATMRGIDFLLTYDEWLKEWEDSGKLDYRGRGRDRYVMARFGDKGPYALGNIKIISGPENNAEGALKVVFTPESLAKISRTHKGKIVSLETRRKQSISHTGFRHTKQAKLKVSLANKGKSVSVETRLKTSAALKGKPKSEEHRQKIAENNRRNAKPHTEESKAKIGMKARGRPQSKETRQKRSESIKAWHAARKLKK